MLGPVATANRHTPIHQVSLPVLSHAVCESMSTTTTTTRDRGDHYGPMEWAQLVVQMDMPSVEIPNASTETAGRLFFLPSARCSN